MTSKTYELRLISLTRQLALDGEARRIRRDANVRASELAKHLLVTPTTLARWEAGVRVPNADATIRWGRALQSLLASEGFDDLP